ncbi:Protein N-methyltransferase NNT1 [Hypsizygus marmoreus]|uniref:Protein N-methyltransferase NNT1 n=1 Tax=Hypsizygus marmoreus TaxID=39966 RepID=A0A369KDG1_HYPMA|nr:Protein N-methyltransferase NNT1 [Hypsizygus marmoreus]
MVPTQDLENSEDILNEALAFLGGEPVVDNDVVNYGPLTLRIAAKEGKANTLLADHLFSPALFLAERIERGLFLVGGLTVIELGAGSGLPSLLTATRSDHPALVVVTDYPDPNILGNLANNVEQNRPHFQHGCRVKCAGYDWGTNADALLNLLPQKIPGPLGYDIMILSDLLHFHGSHDVLIDSIRLLSMKSKNSRLHVSAGNYTHSDVCDNFLAKGRNAGLVFEEIHAGTEETRWLGEMKVSSLDNEALSLRKANCRYWVGRWELEMP